MRIWLVWFAIAAALSTEAAAQPTGETCTPACRVGYTCVAGACVSLCNPPCANGETCSADGRQCLRASTPATPATPVMDSGWAGTAGTLGIITAVLLVGTAITIVIADNPSVGIPVGAAGIVIGGVGIPVVAAGAASARHGHRELGTPTLRARGWLIYGFTLADALVLLGLSIADVYVPAQLGGTAGALGATSAIFMSLDAFASAREARDGVAVKWRPSLQIGALRDVRADIVPTGGLAWQF